MNVIKISLFVFCSFLLSLLVSLQATAQIQFGAKAGLNISNIAVISEDDDNEQDTKMLLRYSLGLTSNYDLNEKLSLQTSLLFSVKGFSVNESDESYFGEVTQKGYGSFYYLDIPINLAYKINNFQIYAGPYAAFGIGGKSKSKTTQKTNLGGLIDESSETFNGKYKPTYKKLTADDEFEDDETPFNGFDYGLNAGIGYKMNNLLFNVGYSYGLGNWIARTEGDDDFRKKNKIQNRLITLSVSYFFGE